MQRQILEMLRQGIIQESSSPWLAACVYVPKKNGEIRICIDYRELNKRTEKNAYPLPLPDEVQDHLERAKYSLSLTAVKAFGKCLFSRRLSENSFLTRAWNGFI